jgi:hypothetical protein
MAKMEPILFGKGLKDSEVPKSKITKIAAAKIESVAHMLPGDGAVAYHPNGKACYIWFNPDLLPEDPEERRKHITGVVEQMEAKFALPSYRSERGAPVIPPYVRPPVAKKPKAVKQKEDDFDAGEFM